MEILLIVLSIVSAIMVWRLIGFGVRSANQINRSTAATAAALQYITDAMPAEARARAASVQQARLNNVRAQKSERLAVVGAAILVFAVGCFLVGLLGILP